MTLSDTDNLAKLIGQKHYCLVQLHRLGQRQLESIGEADLALLLKLLSAKQRLLYDLNAVQRRLIPYSDQQPDARPWRSSELRTECALKVAECQALLAEVMQQELRSQEQMAALRDQAADMLQLGAVATAVHGAYLESHGPLAGQLDLSVET